MTAVNLLKSGSSFLSSQRHAARTESILYRRGADTVTIQATIGPTISQDQTISDFIVDDDMVDFIIRSSDLVLAAVPETPQDGDEIDYDNGGGVVTYTVRRDETDQVSRLVDEFGLDTRIHTKKRGTP